MKITRATIKSFVEKNKELYIKNISNFDAMTDSIQTCRDEGFREVRKDNIFRPEYTLGIKGAWFVGRSRDYFTAYEDDTFKGYKIDNSCGSFILVIKK